MKLSYDSPFMQFMGKIADVMILNLVFILSCIPVVTIGAAWTALYYVSLKLVREKVSFVIKAYFSSFRENFRQATILWLMIGGLSALLALDFKLMQGFESTQLVSGMKIGLGVLTILFAMILQYVFPGLAKFDNSIKATLKNALLLAIANFPRTVLMVLFSAVPVVLTLINEYTLVSGFFLWLMFLFALIAIAKSCLLVKIFDKLIPASSGEQPRE